MHRGIRIQSRKQAVAEEVEVTIIFGPVTLEDALGAAHLIGDYNPAYFFPEGTVGEERDPLPLHPALVSGFVDVALRVLGGRVIVERLRIDHESAARIGDRLKLEAVLNRKDGEEASTAVHMRVFRGRRVLVATAEALISRP